jgi:hypothetical protein
VYYPWNGSTLKRFASHPSLDPPASLKLENIPKEEVLLGNFQETPPSFPCPVENLQNSSSMEATTTAICVVKFRQPDAFLTVEEENKFTVQLTLLVISEASRDVEEEEQLADSCFVMSVRQEMVTKLANPPDQVEKSVEFDELCHTVQAKNPSVTYDVMYEEL